ncbi:MAG: exodeoxyribonuclease VII small subunit [Bacilli bacterium]|nr:exodeoxyribonuclease VII small subunit [Bacilli bacterium]
MEKKIDFETSLKRLDEIIQIVSSKALSLDESVALYEEGQKIIIELEAEISKAQEKLENIVTIE